MNTTHFKITALILGMLFCGATTVRLEAQPKTSTYQITSGTYRVDGGLIGSPLYPLPRDDQAFIVLTLDSDTGIARLEVLPRNTSPPFLVFTNGVVTGDKIRFQYTGATTSGVPATVSTDYTVTNNAGSLSLSGSTMLSYAYPPSCNDCPYAFVHLNVQASLMPSLSVRVSEVEFCWVTASNQTYQVQYSSDVTTNRWTNMGTPIMGDGLVHCIQDKVIAGEKQRLYRVALSP